MRSERTVLVGGWVHVVSFRGCFSALDDIDQNTGTAESEESLRDKIVKRKSMVKNRVRQRNIIEDRYI